MDRSSQNVFVVFNPTAGNAEQAKDVRAALANHFPSPQWNIEIYETTGKEDVPALCRAACERGATLVVSAGGDGTLIGVANGLVHGSVPLGILPLGTGNDLARALGVPLKLDDALKLLAGDHTVIEVDALEVGGRHYFSNVSVGMSPKIMGDTSSAQKKRFGLLAYLATLIKRPNIFQLHRYTVKIDGETWHTRAAEILISNTTLLEKPPFLFGPPETLADGQFETYLVIAESFGDFARLLWNSIWHPGQSAGLFHHGAGKQRVRIEAERAPQLVQADGDVIGHTPVEIQLVPRALHVIMPEPTAKRADSLLALSKAN